MLKPSEKMCFPMAFLCFLPFLIFLLNEKSPTLTWTKVTQKKQKTSGLWSNVVNCRTACQCGIEDPRQCWNDGLDIHTYMGGHRRRVFGAVLSGLRFFKVSLGGRNLPPFEINLWFEKKIFFLRLKGSFLENKTLYSFRSCTKISNPR